MTSYSRLAVTKALVFEIMTTHVFLPQGRVLVTIQSREEVGSTSSMGLPISVLSEIQLGRPRHTNLQAVRSMQKVLHMRTHVQPTLCTAVAHPHHSLPGYSKITVSVF